jgi:hypothetical protein
MDVMILLHMLNHHIISMVTCNTSSIRFFSLSHDFGMNKLDSTDNNYQHLNIIIYDKF